MAWRDYQPPQDAWRPTPPTTGINPDAGGWRSKAKPMGAGGQALTGGPPDPGGGSSYAPQAPTGPSDAPLAGPGYYEEHYKQYGQDLMNAPSASENLYSLGVEGNNPYYNYAQDQAVKSINDAAAARGGFNSSYTMKNIGNTVANIRGMQAKDLTDLAGQADQGKFGRYDRTSSYADRAQDRMENRAKGGIDAWGDLGRDQSRLTQGFYGKAGDEYMGTNMASIEAALKAAGMDAAEVKAYMDFFSTVGGIIAKKGK